MRMISFLLVTYLGLNVLFTTLLRADQKVNPDEFFESTFKKSDVVFVGEWHSISGHKTVFTEVLRSLIKKGIVDSVAIEAVDDKDNEVLQKYLNDPTATPGSKKEDEYLGYLSGLSEENKVRCCWGSILHSSYRELFRELKAASKKIRVCGIDHNDNYHQLNISPEDDFKKLSPEYQSLNKKLYGKFRGTEAREFHIAENVEKCTKDRKKTLVFTGAFHAMDRPVKLDGKSWYSAAALVSERLTDRKITSGTIASPPDNDLWSVPNYPEIEMISPFATDKFQKRNQFRNFKVCDVQTLDGDLKNQLQSISEVYDFIIFGPKSEVTVGN